MSLAKHTQVPIRRKGSDVCLTAYQMVYAEHEHPERWPAWLRHHLGKNPPKRSGDWYFEDEHGKLLVYTPEWFLHNFEVLG